MVLLSCATSNEELTPRTHTDGNPSLVAVIAEPERFDGMTIGTVGVLEHEADVTMLYISPLDAENNVMGNGIAIEFEPGSKTATLAKDFDGQYVYARGIFGFDSRRYRGLPSGVLTQVNELFGPEDIGANRR